MSDWDWIEKVHFGDCLDVMQTFPDDSVDLIFTSPPYADARKHTYGGVKPDDYVDWFLPRAKEMKRVLKPTGSFVLNIKEGAVDGERLTYVLDLIKALRNDTGFRWVEEYIWHKTNSFPGRWRTRFRNEWEHILHFTKNKYFAMYQDAVMVEPKESTVKRGQNLGDSDMERQYSVTGSGFSALRAQGLNRDLVLPGNVLRGHAMTHDAGHSAAFPEWLPEWFIKLFTIPGDVVLDPFLGSGTTWRVANRMRRLAVGIELLEETNMTLFDEQTRLAL